MNDKITISAKSLGELALPDSCTRCFWIKLKVGNKLPFQIFPGIFSSIDSYSKRLVYSWFDRHKGPPVWLEGLGYITGYTKSPHYSKFYIVDKNSGITLRGSPDIIFNRRDGSYIIADFKTAKYTQTQDELLPMYETQLNTYGLIGGQQGISPVSNLALIYTEPVTDETATTRDEHHRENGFIMGFSVYIKQVSLNPGSVQALLAKTREIYELDEIPPHTEDCKDCQCLEGLIEIVR
ncbi:MAG: PD-(D/E)XK nuclease family protein [Candidatus Bathyarchaeota archaeon]